MEERGEWPERGRGGQEVVGLTMRLEKNKARGRKGSGQVEWEKEGYRHRGKGNDAERGRGWPRIEL